MVVHPSAFLQASKVRMFVYSADEEFHNNRSTFQELVTALLSPVLGSEGCHLGSMRATSVKPQSLHPKNWTRIIGSEMNASCIVRGAESVVQSTLLRIISAGSVWPI